MGTVIGLAPEHAIDNAKAVAKAGDDPRKLRRVVRKKPPPGMVSWGQPTFERLVAAPPEPLTSSLRVTHALVMNMLDRPGDGRAALDRLLRDNYASEADQAALIARADALTQTLIDAGVVEELAAPDDLGRTVRVTVDLQETFALNQPLAPFALAALDLLDVTAETYPLDVVSVIEAVLEDPRPVVMAQTSRAKSEAVAQMKADGMDYEQRMIELESVTHPRPLAELLEPMLGVYAASHPWVSEHPLRPKSVVREMYERALDFGEYVRFHAISRAEGTLLRYLTDAYRTLERTVPDARKTEELSDIIEWLGELVRQVDSSLLDEWNALIHPDASAAPTSSIDHKPTPLTRNHRAFTVLVRNAMFQRIELVARRRWDELGALDGDAGFTAERWESALAPYFDEHGVVGIGPSARSPQRLVIVEGADRWQVRQIIEDPDDTGAWAISATVDLAASDEAGHAAVTVVAVGEY